MQLLKTKQKQKKITAGNEAKSPKCEGRQWTPSFLRSAGIYAPDADESRGRHKYCDIYNYGYM